MSYNQPFSRTDSSGTLKTTISLGKTPAIVHSGPFYLMKEPPDPSELTGAKNLINHHHLERPYKKLPDRRKDGLSAFLPNLPGDIDVPGSKENGSSLVSLLETRIITHKEILPLTATQLIGFRLHPGPLPAQYRVFSQAIHKKHKKHKKKQRNFTHDIHTVDYGASESTESQVAERKKKEKKKEKKKDKKDKKDKKRKNHGQMSGNDD